MGRIGAFLHIDRVDHAIRPASESVCDFDDYVVPLTLEEQSEQASRCMNCGVAFCQSGITLGGSKHEVGCPLHNLIPETNDLLYRHRFDDAVKRVALTNPFPEFTGRVCPAPCEVACNLGLHKKAVTINDNERALSDYAWEQGIDPLPLPSDDASVVSIIGSGPAGLTVAWEMARAGWRVRVYEKADRPGGLLMYGIPNMKLPKWVIDRRIDLMKQSGIEFICNTDATEHVDDITAESEALVFAIGAQVPRDVAVDGRELDGIYFAVDYLSEITNSLLDDRSCKSLQKTKTWWSLVVVIRETIVLDALCVKEQKASHKLYALKKHPKCVTSKKSGLPNAMYLLRDTGSGKHVNFLDEILVYSLPILLLLRETTLLRPWRFRRCLMKGVVIASKGQKIAFLRNLFS